MKYLLIFVISLVCIEVQAKQCHLSYDQNQTLFVDCRIGAVPPNYKRVCPMVDGEKDASVYTVTIVEVPDGFFGGLKDLLGLGASRPWSPTEVIADNERILCEVDPDKVQARADARAAREAAQEAERQAKADARGVLKQQCQNVADPFRAAVCELLGGK